MKLKNIDAFQKYDVIELSFVISTLENWVDTGIYMRYTYHNTEYAPSSRRAKSLNENHNNENPIGKTFYVCL